MPASPARRRVERNGETLRVALLLRTREMRRWARIPDGAAAGIVFIGPVAGPARVRLARERVVAA